MERIYFCKILVGVINKITTLLISLVFYNCGYLVLVFIMNFTCILYWSVFFLCDNTFHVVNRSLSIIGGLNKLFYVFYDVLVLYIYDKVNL